MHLVEILSLRSVPAAGISLGLTRRCPLTCAHCSTNSTMTSEQFPEELFARFVDTFHPASHPEILSMSGGEAMLRPKLVRRLAERARKAGTRSSVLSGLFFANSGRIPAAIRDAIAAVDHFSISMDVFHEREVPRADVFRVLDTLLTEGTDLSIHLVGEHDGDPYLQGMIADVQRHFADQVPMLVNAVASFGRARTWIKKRPSTPRPRIEANPCAMAAWPVVGFDGTIVACGNDDALDAVPPHLRLGHAGVDDWETVRKRTLTSSMMRAIRLFGPEYIADRFREGGVGCDGYCQTCMNLPGDPVLEDRVQALMDRPSVGILEDQLSVMQQRAGAQAFARLYGVPQYAALVTLGVST